MGHIKVHGLIQGELFIYNLVSEDLHEAVSYVIGNEGFKLARESFKHAVCSNVSSISID